jgi:hypothetical protein
LIINKKEKTGLFIPQPEISKTTPNPGAPARTYLFGTGGQKVRNFCAIFSSQLHNFRFSRNRAKTGKNRKLSESSGNTKVRKKCAIFRPFLRLRN